MKTTQNIITALAITLAALVGITYAAPTTTGGGGSTPVLATTVTTSAPPPESMPIADFGTLRSYAVEQVVGCNGSIWGETMSYDYTETTCFNFRPEATPPIDEIISRLHFSNYHFKVTDKTKQLNAWGALHNSEGMPLFYGFANDVTVSATDELLSDGIPLKMNSFIPIYVGSGASSANIKRNGQQVMDLNVWNGYVFYPVAYTKEENMTLVLWWNDNLGTREIGYSAMSGLQIPLFDVSGRVGAVLPDHWSYTDKYMTASQILYVGINGVVGDGHETPIASIEITSSRTVKFACAIDNSQVKGGSTEYPAYGWVYKKGDTLEIPVKLTQNQWSEGVVLDKGPWIFRPETLLYEVPVEIPTTPVGEKGN